jgi:hypothetical protein
LCCVEQAAIRRRTASGIAFDHCHVFSTAFLRVLRTRFEAACVSTSACRLQCQSLCTTNMHKMHSFFVRTMQMFPRIACVQLVLCNLLRSTRTQFSAHTHIALHQHLLQRTLMNVQDRLRCQCNTHVTINLLCCALLRLHDQILTRSAGRAYEHVPCIS